MKTILAFLTMLFVVECCYGQKHDPSVLTATDKAFSQMCLEKGLHAAFIFYADDQVVKMQDGNFPIVGKNELVKEFLLRPDTGIVLKWHPEIAEISASEDLGYTFWQCELYLKKMDTTMYGNYVSIWKKQRDGSWKYVLDAGSDTPKPPAK